MTETETNNGRAPSAQSMIAGRHSALRQFNTASAKAVSAMVERGVMMLDVGRLHPTDPLEIHCLELARAQVAVNLATGVPPYMRGSSTVTARVAQAASQDSECVGIRPSVAGWVAFAGADEFVTPSRRSAVRWLVGRIMPGRSAESLSVLSDALDDAIHDVLRTTVSELRQWATKQ